MVFIFWSCIWSLITHTNQLAFQDWPFNDGAAPPKEIITNWLALCKKIFKNPDDKATIGVHCVAGLGRFVEDLPFLCFVQNSKSILITELLFS
jgi:protein tyrosine phosphatase